MDGRRFLFGKYERGRLLGKGTFAKVYYGRQIGTGESVAIKIINKDHVKRAGMMEQIKREISVMSLARHPNIVQLKEVLATKTKIFFVMEYARGGELFEKVEKGRLGEEVARRYFQQLISAVDFCHSRGVSHRDLKPENLLLDENEDLKITDFGLSALPEHIRNDGLLHTLCGTPAYVPPEVLRKKGYDGSKADIWSCGIVLYVLLAGFLPFPNENIMNMYRKVFKADYQFPAWFSQESKDLISKLLVVDPESRISIPEIMHDPWFREGLKPPMAFPLEEASSTTDKAAEEQEQEQGEEESSVDSEQKSPGSKRPKFCNAFEFISSMSYGLDLSSLFENKRKLRTIFTSKCSATTIMSTIEKVANNLSFKVASLKDFKLRLQGPSEGRKGRLSIMAEVFEFAPELAIVEFCKTSGDTFEYARLCDEEIRPSLKDIVWTWQGDGNVNNGEGEVCEHSETKETTTLSLK